jgi:hypothetical protein
VLPPSIDDQNFILLFQYPVFLFSWIGRGSQEPEATENYQPGDRYITVAFSHTTGQLYPAASIRLGRSKTSILDFPKLIVT